MSSKNKRIAKTILMAISTPCALASFIHYFLIGNNIVMALMGICLFVQLYWWAFTIKDWLHFK